MYHIHLPKLIAEYLVFHYYKQFIINILVYTSLYTSYLLREKT